MGAGCICATAPVNQLDIDYEKRQTEQHPLKISVPEPLTNGETTSIINNHPYSKCRSSSESSRKLHKKRRRKSIRKQTFEMDSTPPTLSEVTLSNRPIIDLCSCLLIQEYIDSNTPNLPIRFTKNHDIWDQEYNLFIEHVSRSLPLNHEHIDRYTAVGITEIIFEYVAIDIVYKHGYNISINRGLWPQHFIIESADILTENSTIVHEIRDQLIDSFNFRSIFDICGHCFSETTKLFVHCTDVNIDKNKPTYSQINPLKFSVYSHEIMVLHKGFHIERHNQHFHQDESDPLYFCTLIVLPPNIRSYQGGTFKFYGVQNGFECELNGDRIKTSAAELTQENYIKVSADRYCWSWMLFDKRIQYECDPIVDGKCIFFQMDIDVCKKSNHEIKISEQSSDTINQLLMGRINNEHNMNDTQQLYPCTPSSVSPSPNIVFPPYPITCDDL